MVLSNKCAKCSKRKTCMDFSAQKQGNKSKCYLYLDKICSYVFILCLFLHVIITIYQYFLYKFIPLPNNSFFVEISLTKISSSIVFIALLAYLLKKYFRRESSL